MTRYDTDLAIALGAAVAGAFIGLILAALAAGV